VFEGRARRLRLGSRSARVAPACHIDLLLQDALVSYRCIAPSSCSARRRRTFMYGKRCVQDRHSGEESRGSPPQVSRLVNRRNPSSSFQNCAVGNLAGGCRC
jgi:hypothetical protein